MDVISKNPTNGQEDRSSKSEKLKMLDITRDKPIKVAVKVAVPVKDHPKFNFVGKLLGPKGNSMKRLQEETMCKMAVLGRGSMRDRKKEEDLRASGEARYAHLYDDLHVEISTFAAPAEAHARIAYALAEVRRFLVPDYHDDIRQEQMWEMQTLTTTPSLTQCDDANSPNSMSDMDTSNDDKCVIEGSEKDMDLVTDKSELSTTTQTTSSSTIPENGPIPPSTATIHPITAAIQHQLSVAGLSSILPSAGNSFASIANLSSNPNTLTIPSDTELNSAQTLSLLDPPALLHPALRGVKTINMGRKRPLLGVPRSGMNPTKRTVMTLLARAKNSQALHPIRNTNSTGFADPLQMLASPFILSQPMDDTMVTLPKETLTQGV